MNKIKKNIVNKHTTIIAIIIVAMTSINIINSKKVNARPKEVSIVRGNYTNPDYLRMLAVNSISVGQTNKGMEEYQQSYNRSGNIDFLIEKAMYAKSVNDKNDYDVTKNNIYKYADTNQKIRFKNLDHYSDMFRNLDINDFVPLGLPQNHHAFVVLGLELNDDGSMKQELINRLDVAQQAMYTYPHAKIIVSGNNAKNGMTESRVMANYLIMNGIDSDRIIEESKSNSTYDNCMFTMNKLLQNGFKSATIISSNYHLKRALPLFELENEIISKENKSKKIVFTSAAFSQGSHDEMDYFRLVKDLLRIDSYEQQNNKWIQDNEV